MKKKFLCGALAVGLAVSSLAACGDGDVPSSTSAVETTVEEETTEAEAEDTTASEAEESEEAEEAGESGEAVGKSEEGEESEEAGKAEESEKAESEDEKAEESEEAESEDEKAEESEEAEDEKAEESGEAEAEDEKAEAEAEAGVKAGTYEAEAQGFGGAVTVKLTVDEDGKITDAEIEGADETPAIGGAAIPKLVEQLTEAGSAEIDGIAGATMTSNAVKEAAADALFKAQGGKEEAGEAEAEAEAGVKAGTYEAEAQGFGGAVTVKLTVDEDGKITDAEIEGADETPAIGGAAIPKLVEQLTEAGSAEIDGIAGATMTSNAVKEAAADALFKAQGGKEEAGEAEAEAEAGVKAGTYEAEAQGFGGAVTVKLTVDEDGKITEAAIEGASETPAIGGAAIPKLADQLVEAGSAEIDGIAGATMTSNAVKEAAADALSQAQGGGKDDAKAEGLSFKAGTYTGKATGYNGPVEVSVSFEDDKIKDIEIVSSVETGHVGDIAFDILVPQIIEANGTGVDSVSGATFSSRALKEAVNAAAEEAGVSDKSAFTKNTIEIKAEDAIEDTWDVVVVGGGGAGISAAAQAAQDGNTVLLIEKNAEIGGNTLVSGGQFQSVMPYLVWDAEDPDAETGVNPIDGKTYDKVKSNIGSLGTLRTILEWSEEPFDASYYDDNEYVAGDIAELSKHGVHEEYLPVLKDLKKEIEEYLAWADAKNVPENELTLFSTLNLHIFQTYYGGLRQSADKKEWIYGNVDLVKQFIEGGQDVKPWLEGMGSTFYEDSQQTLIGALWQRENEFIGANVDTDGDGETEEYTGRWGTYFVAPMTSFLNANDKNEIMTRTTATELIEEDGRVTGVKAEQYNGTEVIAHAKKGVILATGGFAANVDLVVKENNYWDPKYLTTATKTTNRSSLTGSGIEMATAVGAATTGMDFTQLMPISWVDNGNLAFGSGDYAIYINPTTGKRFVDEFSERDVLSKAELENGIEHNGTQGVFIEIYNAEQKLPAPPVNQLGEEDVDWRYYTRTIDELGDLFDELGIEADPAVVRETIEEYDKAVMSGGDFGEIGKSSYTRTIGNVEKKEDGSYDESTYDLDGAKLRIRFMAPSTHHTMGGLVVDTDRHVLNEDGEAIEGLYAAGEVTGGIHGGNRLGGNAIVEIIVSGRTAAKAVTADNE